MNEEQQHQDENEEYDPVRDAWSSVEEAYRVIRERMAAGGKGWEPK